MLLAMVEDLFAPWLPGLKKSTGKTLEKTPELSSFPELKSLIQDALSVRIFFSISVLACDSIEIDELINDRGVTIS